MQSGDPKLLLVLLVGLLGITGNVRADDGFFASIGEWVQLDPWQGEMFSEFDGAWRSGDSKSRDIEFENGVRIRQSGYGLDRRIATFSLEADLSVSRGSFESPGRADDRDGILLGYNASLSLLHGTVAPVSVNAHSGLSSGTTSGSLGSRTEFDSETRSIALNFKSRAFPSTLSYSERFLAQTFRSGLSAATSERDDALRSLKFRGRSSKMTVSMERLWFDDRVASTDRDYQSDTANLSHRFSWGKGSRLNTRVNYADRGGFSAREQLGFSETARIKHTENLSSSTYYRYSSLSRERDTISHSGGFGLTHQLYRNLTTNFKLDGSFTDNEVSEETQYGTGLDLSYRKRIPWGGNLSAGAGIGYRINDRQSAGGLLEVVDERQVVDVTRVVVLNQRFIETAGIIVTNAAGTFVFTEGVDYTVAPTANSLTEIRIIPGGSIGVGDTVLFSYRFDSLPSQKFSTIPFHYSVAVNFGWVSFFHRVSGSDEDLISDGDETSLTDRRNSTTGIEFNWTRAATRATFSAESRSTHSGDLESDTFSLRQSLSHRLSPRASLSLAAGQVFRDSDGRQIDSYNADLSADWRPRRNLSVRPRAGFFSRQEPGISNEQFMTWGVDVQWRVRKLSVNLRYDHNKVRGTVNETDEDRLFLTVIRSFR